MWNKVDSIELDLSVYMKAKINVRSKDGLLMRQYEPKWEKKEQLFDSINNQWLKWIKEKENNE